jgi:hypothetical protein
LVHANFPHALLKLSGTLDETMEMALVRQAFSGATASKAGPDLTGSVIFYAGLKSRAFAYN